MKKSFAAYSLGWLAALALFNIVTFVTPDDFGNKYDTLFWVGYAFITLFFLCQLACTYFVFNTSSLQKTFYNIPLFRISVSALTAILIVGGLCMAIVAIPVWIGIIACCLVLVLNVIAAAKAVTAISVVTEIDKKVKSKTLFIKMLSADAEALMAKASSKEAADACKKVYEAIRYSDPLSDPALALVEDKMTQTFSEFSAAVEANDSAAVATSSNALLALVTERNTKCKILK